MKIVAYAVAAAAALNYGCSTNLSSTEAGINVKDVGSYFVGGKTVTLTGLPSREVVFTPGSPAVKVDENGVFEVGQMYVHFTRLQKPSAAFPMLMWHGGGLTGASWETKPDGGDGWEMFFLRHGWNVYISDAVERGRSSWARYPEIYKTAPLFRSEKESWELFRFGERYDAKSGQRLAKSDTQFPVESFDAFVKQGVPRWVTNDEMTQEAYDSYVNKACPCVIVAHSQSANFAYTSALKYPQKIKAIVLVEPTGSPDPVTTDLRPLKEIPILWVWGDHISESPFWRSVVDRQERVRATLNNLGGHGEKIELPKVGMNGNSHMMMMDRNSDEIAQLVNDWLKRKDLVR